MKKRFFCFYFASCAVLMQNPAQADAFPDDLCIVIGASEDPTRSYINNLYFNEKKTVILNKTVR